MGNGDALWLANNSTSWHDDCKLNTGPLSRTSLGIRQYTNVDTCAPKYNKYPARLKNEISMINKGIDPIMSLFPFSSTEIQNLAKDGSGPHLFASMNSLYSFFILTPDTVLHVKDRNI
jgi:hypothetical protein